MNAICGKVIAQSSQSMPTTGHNKLGNFKAGLGFSGDQGS
uniref:Uncharacterized protein n=1 Tax=Rhizophora mucronata TaxID=61149 RepID=A0A2P2PNV7_RHIMU